MLTALIDHKKNKIFGETFHINTLKTSHLITLYILYFTVLIPSYFAKYTSHRNLTL